nr:hypothetical protein KPHV_83440 [Kitasatospora purpeofusca]
MTPAAPPPIGSPPTRAIAVLCLVQVLVALEFSIANVALPTLAHDFDVAARDLQWVLSGYALAYGATLLCGGRLADVHGPRRALLTGLTCFTAASAAAALAPTFALLIAFRVAQGAAAAAATPAVLALLTTLCTGPRRTAALAWWGAAASLGFATGAALGGILTQLADWRAVFWACALLAAAARALLRPRARPLHAPPGGVRPRARARAASAVGSHRAAVRVNVWTFREDDSKVRTGHLPRTMAGPRKLAIGIFRPERPHQHRRCPPPHRPRPHPTPANPRPHVISPDRPQPCNALGIHTAFSRRPFMIPKLTPREEREEGDRVARLDNELLPADPDGVRRGQVARTGSRGLRRPEAHAGRGHHLLGPRVLPHLQKQQASMGRGHHARQARQWEEPHRLRLHQ